MKKKWIPTNRSINIVHMFIIPILLLAHLYLTYSDYTSILNENLIELSEQGEDETEEETENEKYKSTFFNVQVFKQSMNLFREQFSYSLRKRFVTIFSPPPELVYSSIQKG